MKVFTYGSLMTGMGNHHVMKRAGGQLVGPAKIKGRMRAYCSGFPGVNDNSDRWVTGEVYEVPAEGIAVLDQLEGEGSFYHRKTVTTDQGVEVQAYFLEPKDMQGPLIESGNWREYKRNLKPKRRPYDFSAGMGNGAMFWWDEG